MMSIPNWTNYWSNCWSNDGIAISAYTYRDWLNEGEGYKDVLTESDGFVEKAEWANSVFFRPDETV